MNTSMGAPMAHHLSEVIGALARRLGGTGGDDPESGDEGWLGWDAWVRVCTDPGSAPSR
jgi:hypothetical protein